RGRHGHRPAQRPQIERRNDGNAPETEQDAAQRGRPWERVRNRNGKPIGGLRKARAVHDAIEQPDGNGLVCHASESLHSLGCTLAPPLKRANPMPWPREYLITACWHCRVNRHTHWPTRVSSTRAESPTIARTRSAAAMASSRR